MRVASIVKVSYLVPTISASAGGRIT
jgi:hypothetical protein